eukprot:TRINITY_DN3082_c1_g2_i5.p1 TRINITY_DN3082_c1_g2~~TRINITY_DN3082_c1_g2_i5.p1  ORF type:complete len:283 (+),score=60.67 TRINITY_DN3082_c1_g2_i5:22-870(+)
MLFDDPDEPVVIHITNNLSAPPQVREYSELLRRVVMSYGGELRLGRLDAQENGSILQDLQVQQIPTLLAVYGGNIVNRVPGLLTENTLRKFIGQFLRVSHMNQWNPLLEEADTLLESGDSTGAAKIFTQLLHTPQYRVEALALAGLVQCMLKDGNAPAALEIANEIKNSYSDFLQHPRVKQAISSAELQNASTGSGADIDGLLERIKNNPTDLEARYELGTIYQTMLKYDEAFNQMFQIIKIDKEWNNQAAKQFLLKAFDALGSDSDIATKARRRLSNLWLN